jgi:hypothetical protein
VIKIYENYRKIETLIAKINKAMTKLYKAVNDYFENILNAPSTINRILKYYSIGLPSDPSVNKRWIMFNGEIIVEYELVLPKIYCGIDGIRLMNE